MGRRFDTTESSRREGRSRSWKTVWRATRNSESDQKSAPVLWLRSKFGKSELATSSQTTEKPGHGDSQDAADARSGVGFPGWGRTSDVGVAVGLRLGARFVNEAGKGGADAEVVDLAKRVETDASGPVDDDQARSAP